MRHDPSYAGLVLDQRPCRQQFVEIAGHNPDLRMKDNLYILRLRPGHLPLLQPLDFCCDYLCILVALRLCRQTYRLILPAYQPFQRM